MKRGNWKRLLCILLTGVIFSAGCEGKDDKKKDSKEVITVWAWDETFNVKAAKMAAEKYEKSHADTEVKVEIREREEIFADTKNFLSEGQYAKLPDVLLIEDYDIQEMLALYGEEFMDLTDRMNFDQYVDYKKELCSHDDNIYGIPFDSGTTALFYRLDLIEAAGYTEQDMQNLTWEKYMEIGKAVREKTGKCMLTLDPTDLPLVRAIMQSCGQWYVYEDGRSVNLENNVVLRRALEIYEELLENNIGKSAVGWNEFISAFQDGETASVISGAWIISSIKAAEEQTGKWRVAPMPVLEDVENASDASNIGGSSWYVLKNASNAEAGADFLISSFGEDSGFWNDLIREIGIIPCVKNPEQYSEYQAEDPFFGGQKVTALLTGLERRIPVVNYGSNTYQIEDIVEEEFQYILATGDWDKGMEQAQIKAEAVTHR